MTLHVREKAVILHLPLEENEAGIVVDLEPGAARDLNTFVHECLIRVRGE